MKERLSLNEGIPVWLFVLCGGSQSKQVCSSWVFSVEPDLPTLDFFFEYHLCDGKGGGGVHISYVVYIICSVRISYSC